MTSHPPPVPLTSPGVVVVDVEVPDRPPLERAEDVDSALYVMAGVRCESCDRLDANGEGGGTRPAQAVAPVDGAGNTGRPPCWSIVKGMRLIDR